MSGSTPAGWYPDGQGAERWWDGTRWTDHTRSNSSSGDAGPGVVGTPFHQPAQQIPQQGGHPQQGYGQAGQPSWQQPPTGGSGGNGKLIAIVGGALGVVVVVLVVLFVFVLGGGDEDGPGGGADGPGDVAKSYFNGVIDQECDTVELVSNGSLGAETPSDRDDAIQRAKDSCAETKADVGDVNDGCTYDEKNVDENGDEATVMFEITGCDDSENNTSDGELNLVKEDGEWRVDDGSNDSSDAPSSDSTE